MPGQGYGREERIRKRYEIERVFTSGARFSCKGMRLHVLANSLELNRAVFVPVRSYRNSVARNRARRLTRECWRRGKARLVNGFDVAIVLYPGTDSLGERQSQLDRLLGQAGLLAGIP